MISLNLLDRRTKKEIAKNTRCVEIANNLILAAGALLVITLVFAASQRYLAYAARNINAATAASAQNRQVEKINFEMAQIENVQAQFTKWSSLLADFLAQTPEGITLRSVSFDKKSKRLSLSGFAESRLDFLTLESRLKNFELVQTIHSPLANLLHQNKFDFSLEAELNF